MSGEAEMLPGGIPVTVPPPLERAREFVAIARRPFLTVLLLIVVSDQNN